MTNLSEAPALNLLPASVAYAGGGQPMAVRSGPYAWPFCSATIDHGHATHMRAPKNPWNHGPALFMRGSGKLPPASFDHILHVVGLRTGNEMIWIKAPWIVAGVADKIAFLKFAISKCICVASNPNHKLLAVDAAIPLSISTPVNARPIPAFIRHQADCQPVHAFDKCGRYIGCQQPFAAKASLAARRILGFLSLGHRSLLRSVDKSAPGASNTRRRRVHLSGVQPASNRLPTGGRNGS